MSPLPFLLSAAAISLPFSTALAEEETLQIKAGAALLYSPTYLGDDDYQLSLVPAIDISYGAFFASKAKGTGFRFAQSGAWDFGALARLDFGREEDGERAFSIAGDDTDDLIGLGDVDPTLELGLYAAYSSGAWTSRLEILQGIGGHEGLTGSADLKYNTSTKVLGKRGFVSLGPRIDFGDSRYTSEFFDVSARQSAASGLSVYDADGGIHSAGLSASLIIPLTERYTLISFASYTRLLGDVADSSLVQERGSEDQFSAGIALTYSF